MPSPEDELFVYNWTDYIGEKTIPDFEKKYGIKVTYDFFDNTDEAYAKLGDDGGGYDVSFPISVDIPAFREQGRPVKLDKSLLPNIVNLGTEWANPGYDPDNEHSVPYMWWTTGVGYDTTKITDTPTSSEGTLGPALREAHLDARRLPGGLRASRSSSSATRPTRPTRPSSTRPWRCSSSRSRSSGRTQHRHRRPR